MESLTERLSFLMKQISDDQINQLVLKNRLEKELGMEREQKVNSLQSNKYVKNEIMCEKTKSGYKPGKKVVSKSHGLKPNELTKPKKLISLVNIWSGPKPIQPYGDNDLESSIEPPKEESKAKNKFLKAAKLAVLISQVKKGHDICTCESLDAKCKVHDL